MYPVAREEPLLPTVHLDDGSAGEIRSDEQKRIRRVRERRQALGQSATGGRDNPWPRSLDGNRDARTLLGNFFNRDRIPWSLRQRLTLFDEFLDYHADYFVDVA